MKTDNTSLEEQLAKKFHETYERLAPEYGYRTRKSSAVAWEDVPANNKELMIAVAKEISDTLIQHSIDTAVRKARVEEAKIGYELTSYNIVNASTSYKKAWRTGANRIGVAAKSHKLARIKQLEEKQ